jgi:hypothetical protein
MADPTLKIRNAIQSNPIDVTLGSTPDFNLNVYANNGKGQPVQSVPDVDNATCSIRDVTDISTEIDDPTVTLTDLSNGVKISFPIDTTASPLNAVGRYVAVLTYDFNTKTEVDYIYFNVVDVTNIFGSAS